MTLHRPAMRTRIAAQLVIEHLLSRQTLSRHLLSRQTPVPPRVTVRRLLATLPADWTAFHAVPIGTSAAAIDHILVGPGGVFTINIQHHCGKRIRVGTRTVTVSGHRKGYLPAAEHEAERVSDVLRERMPLVAPVQPVVALVDAKRITFRRKPEQVKVLDARGLLGWLQRLQPVLTDEEIAEAVVILDSPSMWR